MPISLNWRTTLFFLGLAAILAGLALDPNFAADSTAVPEPNTLALLGIGGAAAMVASFFRRRRK